MTWTGIRRTVEYLPPIVEVMVNHVILDRGQAKGERTDLGHDNVLAPEPVIRVRLIEIYDRDRDRGVRADILHGRHL